MNRPQPPKRIDPFLGTEVYGNVLDFYDNPTYTIRLYMVRDVVAKNISAKEAFTFEKSIDDKDTVTLAQTSVTGIQIDNLEMPMLLNPDKAVQLPITFTIHEPGSATFLDQLKTARIFLGYPNTPSITMFMDINFLGYEQDSTNETEGGKAAPILKFRSKLVLTNIDVSIDMQGATYNCSCLPFNDYALADRLYSFGIPIETTGATVEEHLYMLQQKLNDHHKKMIPIGSSDDFADEVFIDVKSLVNIDNILIVAGEQANDDPNKLPGNEQLIKGDTASIPAVSLFVEEALTNVGLSAEKEISSYDNTISFPKGTTMHEYMTVLLSMSPTMQKNVSRKTNLTDPDSEVHPEQPYNWWFKIEADVEELKYHKARNTVQKKYIFRPIIYRNTRSDVNTNYKEQQMTEAQKQTRLSKYISDGFLVKAYDYIFTGMNDQVLNLDIRYDSGIPLLLSPANIGDTSVEAFKPFANQTPAQIKTDAVDEFLTSALLNEFTGDDYTDEQRAAIAEGLGVDEDQLFDRIRELNEQGDTFNTAIVAGGEISTNPTSDEELTGYEPSFTSRRYSADLVNEAFLVDTQKLIENNYIDPENLISVSEMKPEGVVENRENPVKEGTTDPESTANQLFGQLATQYADNRFMVSCEISLRGDPWYLGSPVPGANSENIGNFRRDDNLFWLRLSRPTRYDMNLADEDNNSGYWAQDGICRSFTGVYRMIKVVNKFNNGVFTSDLSGLRMYNLNQQVEQQEELQEERGKQFNEQIQVPYRPGMNPTQGGEE